METVFWIIEQLDLRLIGALTTALFLGATVFWLADLFWGGHGR